MGTTEEPIRLTLKRRSKQVEIEDESGRVRLLEVRELDGAEADSYENTLNAREKLPTGEPKDVRGLSELYISLAVRDVSPVRKTDMVTPEEVAAWPGGVRDAIFAMARDLVIERRASAKKAPAAAAGSTSP